MKRLIVKELKKALEGVDENLPVIVNAKSTDKKLIVEEENFFYDKYKDVAKFYLVKSKDIDGDTVYNLPEDYDVNETEKSLKGNVYTVERCFSIRV